MMKVSGKHLALIFVIGCTIYAAFAANRLAIHSQDNHFVYLADAFLKGQTGLVRRPHHGNDWASYQVVELKGDSARQYGVEVRGYFTRRKGKADQFRTLDDQLIDIPKKDRGKQTTKHFVSFPPGPAVLLMPFVAAVGYGANDVVFTVAMAGLNLVFMWLLLLRVRSQGYIERTDRELAWFLVLFGFGTAVFWCSVLGQVWFTALIVGLTFHTLYLYFAFDCRRPFWAGVFLACAFASRASLVFAALFFYWQLFVGQQDRFDSRQKMRAFVLFTAPCLVVGVSLLIYNYVRFENAVEFGHTYLAGGHIPRIRDFGLFHPHFVNRNLAAAFTLTPRFSSAYPYVQLSKHGMSLFLTTPVFVYLFFARAPGWLKWGLWMPVLIISIPLLMYQNTGWEQFGYRFILDVLPYLILILVTSKLAVTKRFKTLILVGVIVNAIGAATFQRGYAGKLYGHFMTEEPKK
ncbi:MAG: hypothetical protein ACON3Z_04420 [Bradymonadia bacterium]